VETGFVIVSYVATFGGVALLATLMFRRARVLAERLPAEDRPWI
jgi:hypothetical protein